MKFHCRVQSTDCRETVVSINSRSNPSWVSTKSVDRSRSLSPVHDFFYLKERLREPLEAGTEMLYKKEITITKVGEDCTRNNLCKLTITFHNDCKKHVPR